jgi:homoserine dehydrogenase
VADRPGVLAAVAGVFGAHGVSIKSMEQESVGGAGAGAGADDGSARLMFITHGAREADVRATLHELRSLDVVRSIGSVLRVIGRD